MLGKSQKLGVIAGNGALPGLVVEAARKQGYEVCVIGIIKLIFSVLVRPFV